MAGMREWMNGTGGKVAGIILLFAALAAGYYGIRSAFGSGEAADLSRNRWFIDAKTGKAFRYELKLGDMIPVKAPSGDNSGYEAELCYWTADGKTKPEPTLVLLNAHQGKPEPTFCPDCKRLVRPLNPTAVEGSKPPPTESEYTQRRAARDAERK